MIFQNKIVQEITKISIIVLFLASTKHHFQREVKYLAIDASVGHQMWYPNQVWYPNLPILNFIDKFNVEILQTNDFSLLRIFTQIFLDISAIFSIEKRKQMDEMDKSICEKMWSLTNLRWDFQILGQIMKEGIGIQVIGGWKILDDLSNLFTLGGVIGALMNSMTD